MYFTQNIVQKYTYGAPGSDGAFYHAGLYSKV